MAHKVFLFQSGSRLEQRSLHAGWPLSAQVVTNEEKRVVYTKVFSSRRRRRRRRSGFLDGSSRLVDGLEVWGLLWRFWTPVKREL